MSIPAQIKLNFVPKLSKLRPYPFCLQIDIIMLTVFDLRLNLQLLSCMISEECLTYFIHDCKR